MADEKKPEQVTKTPEPTASPEAAAAPLTQPQTGEQKPPANKVVEAKEAAEPAKPIAHVLLFGKYDASVVTISDPGMARYINITPISVPHTGGRHTAKAFGKTKMSIVERLINNMMRTEDFTGKKMGSYMAVENAFATIHAKTGQNPLQVLVDALINTAPREEVTRLRYGGISVPKAVDVAPARRVDLALRYVCRATLESSHGSKTPIDECLANQLLLAAKNDMNSSAVAKKEEIERVSSSAR
ncbi:MAG: 30S ribosomal protein S7 [Methanomassiliicoccus sp.]|nr:MAG: 30S ribosomal protein S7 [Methanomassiliicoccus sp.]